MPEFEIRGSDVYEWGAAKLPLEIAHFEHVESAIRRVAFVTEALSWQGTPFVNCADVKGRKGGVDCAMLLVRSSVDQGLLAPFDPRPYPPGWHLHREEERFIGWIKDKLGAAEIELARARFGDVLVYKFGKCFAHGAIVVNSREVVHAHGAWGGCFRSLRTEHLLAQMDVLGGVVPRPVRAFSLWGD